MKRLKTQFFLAMILSSLVVVSAQAQEEKQQEKKKQESAEEKQDEPKTFAEIRSALFKEQAELRKEVMAAKRGSDEQQAAIQKYYGVADKYVDKVIAMIKEDPSDQVGSSLLTQLAQMTRNAQVRNKIFDSMFEVVKAQPDIDSSFDMLMMLVTGPVSAEVKAEATGMLMKNFGDSDKMGDFAMSFARAAPSKDNIKLMRDLLKKSMKKTVQGPATYALAKMLSKGEDTKEEATKLLKSIPEKFKGVMVFRGRRELAAMVAGELFELERLQIGMDVPDIVGEDIDGVEFKLSDYKGKVVVIDFWGHW